MTPADKDHLLSAAETEDELARAEISVLDAIDAEGRRLSALRQDLAVDDAIMAEKLKDYDDFEKNWCNFDGSSKW